MYGNDPRLVPEYLSTGIPELDKLMNGGLKKKSISLWVGMEGQGKTWTSQKAAAHNLQLDYEVAYVDVERAYMPGWWEQVGVNTKKLHVAQPRNAEECLDMVMVMLSEYDLIIVDSISALMPKYEEENSAESNQMALQARFNGKFFRDINGMNERAHVMVINQLRTAPGVIYGNPTYIPGGAAQRFFASSIIQARKDSWIENDKVRSGWNLKYEILGKHRGDSNDKDFAIVPVLFKGTIDKAGSLVNQGLELGIITQDGAKYEVMDGDEIFFTCRGKARLIESVTENEELFQNLERLIAAR